MFTECIWGDGNNNRKNPNKSSNVNTKPSTSATYHLDHSLNDTLTSDENDNRENNLSNFN